MAEPVTAGGYLRMRREAAGVTLPEVARIYARNALGAAAAELMLGEAENNLIPLGEPAINRLREIFAFAADIYLDLAAGLPPPDLCRICACSWNDPCEDGGHGCAWLDASHTICTACQRKALAA